MTTTPNLGLTTYSTASGSVTTFLTFRLALAGNTSNMSIIDAFAGNVSGSIASLQNNVIVSVHASMIIPNVYEATIGDINSYLTDSMIALELNVTNTGAATLNINSLGAISLKKINYLGSLVNIEAGDLKENRWALFFYNGNYYVLMGTTTADQISVAGNENNFLAISGSGTIKDSGISSNLAAIETFFILLNKDIALTDTDINYMRIPSKMNGYTLVEVAGSCDVASTSGSVIFTVTNTGLPMLTTNIMLDEGITDTIYSASPAVIDTNANSVLTGDKIWISPLSPSDCGTDVLFAGVELTFRAP